MGKYTGTAYRDERYYDLDLFDQCLVHRYRYYIMNNPVESDRIYDMFEAEAIKRGIPENHGLLTVGADTIESYPNNIIDIAKGLDSWYNDWFIIKEV